MLTASRSGANLKSRTPTHRAHPVSAVIDLADLGAGRLVLKGSLTPGELDFRKHGIGQVEPLEWSGFIERQGSEVRISGVVTTELVLDCVRCLDPVRKKVRRKFDLFFRQRKSLIYDADAEIELAESDTQTSFMTGTELGLGDIMQEQVLLTIPMKPMCGSKCRGLCPICGSNLNKDKCECPVEKINPAFETLKEFKKHLENRG